MALFQTDDPNQLSDRQLLLTILGRIMTMDQRIQDVVDAESLERAQIELLITAFQANTAQTAALQAQIADLQANGFLTADQANALNSTVQNMQSEQAKVAAALAPPPPPAPPPAG